MPEPRPAGGPDLDEPGRPWLNVAKLQFALKAAMSAQQVTAADLGRATRITHPQLTELFKHGDTPSARTLGKLLAWLHMDAAEFVLAPGEPSWAAPAAPVTLDQVYALLEDIHARVGGEARAA
jgi:transcriptional regulator with XRE-family HTH domain